MRLLALRWSVKTKVPEKALTSLISSDIGFTDPRREEEGFSFVSHLLSKKQVTAWSRETGYPVSYEFTGIFTPVLELKHRPGIILGTVLSLFLIYLSTFYVWSVRIEGNSKVSDSEIIELLRRCGFEEGVRKNAVDVNEIQNVALANCHELSFLSINIHGMVADVVVHERVTSPRAVNESEPYNLVADADGVVVSSLVLDGQSLFEVGDTVFKGQLLVSGLVDSTSGSAAMHRARGKVYARTFRELTFEIPLMQTERICYTAETVKGVRVLGHSFHRRIGGEEDIEVSVKEKELSFLGLTLPVTYEERTVRYYRTETRPVSLEEAEVLAHEEYRGYISTELDSAEILEEHFERSCTPNALILKAEVSAIENIAKEMKIYTE